MNSVAYADNNKKLRVSSADDTYAQQIEFNIKKEKKFLDLPRNNIRRTSLPTSDEKSSPKSPRRFLDYIKVSY
jgi:hypothetical protein